MSATRTALTLEDLEAALADERHNGWGYAGREYLASASRRARLDRNVVAVANEMGLDYEALMEWTNSKYGRYLCDVASDGNVTRERVRMFLNDSAFERFVAEGSSLQRDVNEMERRIVRWIGDSTATIDDFDVSVIVKPQETRTVLVHLNVEVPAHIITTPTLASDLADEVRAALEVGTDEDHAPFLAESKVEIALAEEI